MQIKPFCYKTETVPYLAMRDFCYMSDIRKITGALQHGTVLLNKKIHLGRYSA